MEMQKQGFFRACLAVVPSLLLAACLSASGPEKALDTLADALDANDSAAFLSGVDMGAFAENHIRNMTADAPALGSLDALGNLLGLGSVDRLLDDLLDMRGRLETEFRRGVSSGARMARCRTAETPDCPWVPLSLREAKIVEVGADAAIARVTTPARLTSWLALRKVGGRWLVVGQAVMEETARSYALGAGKKPSAPDGAGRQRPAAPAGESGGVTAI